VHANQVMHLIQAKSGKKKENAFQLLIPWQISDEGVLERLIKEAM
jgi:hypothetical protein